MDYCDECGREVTQYRLCDDCYYDDLAFAEAEELRWEQEAEYRRMV